MVSGRPRGSTRQAWAGIGLPVVSDVCVRNRDRIEVMQPNRIDLVVRVASVRGVDPDFCREWVPKNVLVSVGSVEPGTSRRGPHLSPCDLRREACRE